MKNEDEKSGGAERGNMESGGVKSSGVGNGNMESGGVRLRNVRHSSLRTVIAVRFAALVLAVIFLVSIVSNLLISRQFEKYVEEQQSTRAEELAQNLSWQYDRASAGWNLDYIHGLGMYALNEGYIIRLFDADGAVLWDAENHDMTLCHQMMDTITYRMQENRPDLEGDFVIHRFDLEQGGSVVGFLDVSYYTPYYFDENDFQFITALNRILVAVGIISLLGAAAMGAVLAGTITKPVIKAAEITRQISEGDYATRFRDDVRIQELSELARSVNQMAEALEKQEKLRKRLTSDVAHELRTPVANVASYLEAILEGVWEPTPERLQSCYDELERISGLVSDLERLHQAEDENLRLQKTRADLLELARFVERNFETQMEQKQLACTVEGDHAEIFADCGRIQQVLTNLISNAVKYSNEGGNIRILVAQSEDGAVIRVEDDGIGIAPEEQELIFERFYRTDRSRNRKTGGAGIGLAIVKTIVQAHGGRITVESGEGRGSSFIVTLPQDEGRPTERLLCL